MAAIGLALQDARALKLGQHPVQGGFGQAGPLDQALQRHALVVAGDQFEQRKQAQRRRVALEGLDGLVRVGIGGSGGGIHHIGEISTGSGKRLNSYRFMELVVDVMVFPV